MAEENDTKAAAKTATTPAPNPARAAELPPAIRFDVLQLRHGKKGEDVYHDIALAGGFGDMRVMGQTPDLDLTGLQDIEQIVRDARDIATANARDARFEPADAELAVSKAVEKSRADATARLATVTEIYSRLK